MRHGLGIDIVFSVEMVHSAGGACGYGVDDTQKYENGGVIAFDPAGIKNVIGTWWKSNLYIKIPQLAVLIDSAAIIQILASNIAKPTRDHNTQNH